MEAPLVECMDDGFIEVEPMVGCRVTFTSLSARKLRLVAVFIRRNTSARTTYEDLSICPFPFVRTSNLGRNACQRHLFAYESSAMFLPNVSTTHHITSHHFTQHTELCTCFIIFGLAIIVSIKMILLCWGLISKCQFDGTMKERADRDNMKVYRLPYNEPHKHSMQNTQTHVCAHTNTHTHVCAHTHIRTTQINVHTHTICTNTNIKQQLPW